MPARPRGGPQRPRLIEAHKLTAEWYAELLATPEALTARQFLDTRGFDAEAAAHFGVGFSPRGGEDLFKHLQQKGFTDEELVTSGLVGQGQRGHYDRFRGRLMWPIRDSSGDTIGFGARRIFDDDRIEAKYLNTPETPIYKKSQVLYGIDLARREIARASQAVIVEGYTDVMACHLAGREDRRRHLRHLLRRRPRAGDPPAAAGPRRVPRRGDLHLRRRRGRPEGGDPRLRGRPELRRPDLRRRRAHRDGPVRPAASETGRGRGRVRSWSPGGSRSTGSCWPTWSHRYDLDRADGRIDAMREAAKLVTSIRDRSKVDAFARELAGMLGVEPVDVQREVRRAAARASAPAGAVGRRPGAPPRPAAELPDPRDPRLYLERETLKLVVQHPSVGRAHGSTTSAPRTSPMAPTARCGPASRQPAGPPPRMPSWASNAA